MATVNVSLPETMQEWIEHRVLSGAYASASEYISDLIRHDRAQQQAVVDALIVGENSGLSSRSVGDIIRGAKANLRHGEI
jgi:antitoxin ParD1/3/4